VPLVGATIAGVLIAIVTAFTDFPADLLVWVVFFLVYQQVENNVLQPFVYRRAVSVAPLLVIVSILVGSALLGVLGALVAIPVAAAVQIIVRDLWTHGNIRGAPPDAEANPAHPEADVAEQPDDEPKTEVAPPAADPAAPEGDAEAEPSQADAPPKPA